MTSETTGAALGGGGKAGGLNVRPCGALLCSGGCRELGCGERSSFCVLFAGSFKGWWLEGLSWVGILPAAVLRENSAYSFILLKPLIRQDTEAPVSFCQGRGIPKFKCRNLTPRGWCQEVGLWGMVMV